jgi:hypothetical protein
LWRTAERRRARDQGGGSGTSMKEYAIVLAGGTVRVYDFLELDVTVDRIATLERLLQRLPAAHVPAIYPIFVIDVKPAGGLSGGTWTPGRVRTGFRGRTARTGVPDAELDRIVPEGTGLIGIPQNRWAGREPMATVLHEIGHAIDIQLDLTPPWLRVEHLLGVRPVCGDASPVARHAVEAYARWITNPSLVCRDLPPGQTQVQADNRIFATLAATPAFRLVPQTWDPSRRRRHGRWAGADPPPEAVVVR